MKRISRLASDELFWVRVLAGAQAQTRKCRRKLRFRRRLLYFVTMELSERFILLGAQAMAAFLDFAVGVLIFTLIANGFGHSPTLLELFIAGWLALLPDFDMIPSVLRGQSTPFDHRQTLFHRPALLIPVATSVAYLAGGHLWAAATFVATFAHFLHDTDWQGERNHGIAWLWPFSSRLWSWYGSYTVDVHLDHHTWLREHWFGPSRQSVTELLGGFMALTVVGFLLPHPLSYWFLGLFLIVGVMAIVWATAMRNEQMKE